MVEAVYIELSPPDGMRFGLYQRDGFTRNSGAPAMGRPTDKTTATEVYLHCEDLDGAIARVAEAGGTPLSPLAPRVWGDDAAYFADPDGNVVVLARPSPSP